METTLRVQAAQLVAGAQRLRAAARQLIDPAILVHPPLAADQTSVSAAARLTSAANALQSAGAVQAAALLVTADHLAMVAAAFTEQEAVNAAAVQALGSDGEPVVSPGRLAPVPSVPADARPPLPVPEEVDGEAAARQLWAGSPSAGSGFTQSWRRRSAAGTALHDVIRDLLPTLPDIWGSPRGTEAVSTRLLRHTASIEVVATRAGALADQAERHARGYSSAAAGTPKPAEFEAVRTELHQAQEANARVPGQYTPLVSSLIARQGTLRQQALNAQTRYHEETETSTGPTLESPAEETMSPEQAGQLAAVLPGMVPGLLGAVGGMVGGAVAMAVQLPQALLQTGQQLAQAATQGLTGSATPTASEIAAATRRFDASSNTTGMRASGGSTGSGATMPAGATEMTPVAPSTSPEGPSATTLPQGAPPAVNTSATGPAGVSMGMPMGMMRSPATADDAKQVAADKKIVIPVAPHTESVTGKGTAERLAAAADGRRTTARTGKDGVS